MDAGDAQAGALDRLDDLPRAHIPQVLGHGPTASLPVEGEFDIGESGVGDDLQRLVKGQVVEIGGSDRDVHNAPLR